MGYILCIGMYITHLITKQEVHLIVAGLFAIAGAIESVAHAINKPRIHIG